MNKKNDDIEKDLSNIIDFSKALKKKNGSKSKPAKEKTQFIKGNNNIQIGGDVNINVKKSRRIVIDREADDITEAQASEIKKIVDDIAEYESSVSGRTIKECYMKTWKSLQKRMQVTTYKKIKQSQFETAKKYLISYRGRLKRQLKPVSTELYRLERYTAIYTSAKTNHGLSEQDVKDYLFANFGVMSLKDLSIDDLDKVYRFYISK